jgi:hypothetical protein
MRPVIHDSHLSTFNRSVNIHEELHILTLNIGILSLRSATDN